MITLIAIGNPGVEGGFWSNHWLVYIKTILLREASWLLYFIVGHPNPAIYIVSSFETSYQSWSGKESDCTDL